MARLDVTLALLFILYMCNNVCSYEVSGVEKDLLDELISSKHLRKDGYYESELSVFQEVDIMSGDIKRASSDTIRQRRSATNDLDLDTPLHFTFTAFHRNFSLRLTYNHRLLPPGAQVVTVHHDRQERFTGELPNCFMTGRTDDGGVAALEYCHGIAGSVAEGDTLYRIDPVGQMGEHFKETILVSKSPLFKKKVPIDKLMDNIVSKHSGEGSGQDSHGNRSRDQAAEPRDKTGRSGDQDGRPGDEGRLSGDQGGRPRDHGRHRRQAWEKLTVETAVFLDEDFVDLLEAAGDTNETLKVIKVVAKWNLVQAMWRIPEELGFDVVIELKRIEFWSPNPSWFTLTSNDITATLYSFCDGITPLTAPVRYSDFDHLHLHSAVTDSSAMGLAISSAICSTTRRCSIASDTDFYNGYISAHEKGHGLNMRHDDDLTCPSGGRCNGFMATSGFTRWGWSSMSETALADHVADPNVKSCLQTANVPALSVHPDQLDGLTLSGLWPGMELNNDELCEENHGPGYQKREMYFPVDVCTFYSCVNMNEGPLYSTMSAHGTPIYGEYCAEGKVCSAKTFECMPWADTRIPLANIPVIVGGWSDWGPESACSRTCGLGMKVKTRTCTNPRPLNSGPCEGSAHFGSTCYSDGCANPSVAERAGEVCASLLANGVISSSQYSASGGRRASTTLGKCEVKCNAINGHTIPLMFRFAFMPDATPCSTSAITPTIAETRGYPRVRGLQSLCIRGSCEVFGCSGVQGGAVNDGCGVCGGDGSTCIFHDVKYCQDLAADERVPIVRIPAGAYDLQFHFSWAEMDEYYVELWDADYDEEIIASMIEYTFKEEDMDISGCLWNYDFSKQHLYCHNGVTEWPIDIKLYSLNGGTNTCLNIEFSQALGSDQAVFFVAVEDGAEETTTTTTTTTTSTPTSTSTSGSTATASSTSASTATASSTSASTATASSTSASTATGSSTSASTATASSTSSSTAAASSTSDGTATASSTSGSTATASSTSASTATGSSTSTSTSTATGSSTSVSTATASSTSGSTATASSTSVSTASASSTSGSTATASSTSGSIATASSTSDSTATASSTSGSIATTSSTTGSGGRSGTTTAPCGQGMFYCTDSTVCFSYEQMCDGVNHCPDGEDESDGWCCQDCSGTVRLSAQLSLVLVFCLLARWILH